MQFIRNIMTAAIISIIPAVPTTGDDNPAFHADPTGKTDHQRKFIDEMEALHASSDMQFDRFKASFTLGRSYFENEDWQNAAFWFSTSVEYKHLKDYSYYYRAYSLFMNKEYETSYRLFSDLSSSFPSSRWKESALLKAGEALLKLGRHAEAAQIFSDYLDTGQGSSLYPDALLMLSECQEKEGRFWNAYNSLKEIWMKYPASTRAQEASKRMSAFTSRGDGLVLYNVPSFEQKIARITKLSNDGHKHVINEIYELLDELNTQPWRPQGLKSDMQLKLAQAYFRVRDDEKSLDVINKILISPARPGMAAEINFLKGRILQRSGRRAEAMVVFEDIAGSFPSYDYAVRSLFRVADMVEGDKDIPRASSLYKEIETRYPDHELSDNALWKQGWLSYMSRDLDSAMSYFKRLLSEYPLSEMSDTALYWIGRTYEKKGETDVAADHFRKIIKRYPSSYYSILSGERLTAFKGEQAETPPSTFVESMSRNNYTGNCSSPNLENGRNLLLLGYKEDASIEFTMAYRECGNGDSVIEIARLLAESGAYQKSQRIIIDKFPEALTYEAGKTGNILAMLAYPLAFQEIVSMHADENSINRFLIHAIIKEESAFNPFAISPAGAVGLMQVMPSTAQQIANDGGEKGYKSNSLNKPDVNIRIGSLYLKKLMEQSRSIIPLALASYNAGPDAAAAWQSLFGADDIEEFIENIPYKETRNYVKRVLKSYYIYSRIYGGIDGSEGNFGEGIGLRGIKNEQQTHFTPPA